MDITLKNLIPGTTAATIATKATGPPQLAVRFEPGQILSALISARNSDGKYILDFGKSSFAASSEVPLRVGQQVLLQVTDSSSRVTLKMLPSAFSDSIAKGLPLLAGQTKLLPQLTTLFQKIGDSSLLSDSNKEIFRLFTQLSSSEETIVPDGKGLQLIAEKLGLQHERHLAEGDKGDGVRNVKNALLELTVKSDKADPLVAKAMQLVELIEFQQQINVRLAEHSLFYLPLIFPFLEQGYVLFDQEKDGREEEREGTRTHSVNLNLEGLGNLEIILRVTGKHLSISFLTEDEEKASFLEGLREDLLTQLTAMKVESVNFSAGAEDAEKKLLHRIVPKKSGGVLDTQI
ncbi:MAG: flagellar hook-length control protein FliK [Desulfobulbaceae bacterium]|nr:flagellar hook-length control protein FliK [Desulfobulbaceae bacterium]